MMDILGIKHEILIQKERGLTNAVVSGVKHSKYPFIVVMDADGSHDPMYVPLMFLHINDGYDLVVGTKVYDETSWKRRTISRVFRLMGNSILGTDIRDCMSGFVMGKREMFELIKPSMDYKFLLQMLVYDPNVLEFPIYFHERKMGKSKANLLTGLRTLTNMCKLRLSRRTRN